MPSAEILEHETGSIDAGLNGGGDLADTRCYQ